jgi:cation diffusion facilitator family transporter
MGHGKAEYIYAMFISITMILLGVKLLYNSVYVIINGQEYHFSFWLIIVCIVTVITKLFLYIYTSKVGKKHHNLLVEANSKDHRNDIFVTLLTLLSVIMSYYGIKYVDAIVGLLIALWIVYTGVMIFIQSYDVLMDKTISSETRDEVLAIIDEYPEIVKVNHFNATPVGYKYMVNFSIFVDGNLSTFESHEIADRLEKDIHKRVEEIYLTVIHVNPIEIKKDTK